MSLDFYIGRVNWKVGDRLQWDLIGGNWTSGVSPTSLLQFLRYTDDLLPHLLPLEAYLGSLPGSAAAGVLSPRTPRILLSPWIKEPGQ